MRSARRAVLRCRWQPLCQRKPTSQIEIVPADSTNANAAGRKKKPISDIDGNVRALVLDDLLLVIDRNGSTRETVRPDDAAGGVCPRPAVLRYCDGADLDEFSTL